MLRVEPQIADDRPEPYFTRRRAECMATRRRLEAWVVTHEFWQRGEPRIPVRERSTEKAYVRNARAGR